MRAVLRLSCHLRGNNRLYQVALPNTGALNGSHSVRYFAAVKEDKKAGGAKSGGNSKKARAPSEGKAEVDSIYKFLNATDDAEKFTRERTPEEIEHRNAVARTYQKNLFASNNATNYDLTNKIWLQHEAIRALPPDQQELARKVNSEPVPENRPWPRWDTPPIKGFNPRDYMDKKRDKQEEEEREAREEAMR